jgi:hypothetical protein
MIKQIYRFLNPKFQNVFLEYRVDLKPRYGHGKPAHMGLHAIIDSNRKTYEQLIKKALSLKENIWTIRDSVQESDPVRPVWNNGFLPGLDIIALYTMLSENASKKYMEIGSGTSTRVAYLAKLDQKLKTEIISIDPQPRSEIDSLADRILREPFETLDTGIVDELNANDILFVDGSHRILPNSDTTVFFLEVLPRLKKGVIVHIHDVYLPYDYPKFMCDRVYSEQYGLAMYLMANPVKYKPILPNYFISEDRVLSEMIAPIWNHPNLNKVERHGGSFWLRINE